jgi:hypothetical protein
LLLFLGVKASYVMVSNLGMIVILLDYPETLAPVHELVGSDPRQQAVVLLIGVPGHTVDG